jgi:hypothetical protein
MGSLLSVGGIGERNVAQLARGDDYLSWNATHLTPVPGQCQLPQKWCNQHDARLIRSNPVSTRINHAASDDEDCAKPIELEVPPQGQLFA